MSPLIAPSTYVVNSLSCAVIEHIIFYLYVISKEERHGRGVKYIDR